jgi:chromatin remodeling complex protein RSC6
MSSSYFSTTIEQFVSITETIGNLKTQLALLQLQLKTIEKRTTKEHNHLKKKQSATVIVSCNPRKPSGFATPSKVSNELCEFLNKTEGTEMARTEVTKSVVAYIKENCLHQDSIKKNIIKPDDKLKSLLGIGDDNELTYFNLQKYMNKHFTKHDDVSVEHV